MLSLILFHKFYICKTILKEISVKKALISLILLLFAVILAPTVLANDTIAPISDGTIYYSPSQNIWSHSSSTTDAIKISKRGETYTTNDNGTFSLKSDFAFISKNQFAAVDNSNLKMYTAVYLNGKFTPQEMTKEMVQAMFDEVKVLAVSEMTGGVGNIKRTPFSVENCLILNDTNLNFSDYVFSPTSVQRSPIRGMFLVRQVGKVKFMKKGDVQKLYPQLQIIIRNDAEKYNSRTLYLQRPVVNYQYKN